MRVRLRPLTAPKRGNRHDEYEDAVWPHRTIVRGEAVRCAVADGATEASFSGVWARLLVDGFRRGVLSADLAVLPTLQKRWQDLALKVPLPWYAEEKARLGAFSSLLGVTVSDSRWEAIAVGDSCLFHRRGGDFLASFPIARSDDLSAAPHLISSLAARNGALLEHVHRACGSLQPGDVLYLATDALAGWMLRRIEGGNSCDELDTLRPATFSTWLDGQRDARAIRNDDTTLIRIDLH